MERNTPIDLKQVAALFNDCIATIRSKPLPNLDAAAEEWIQQAKYKLMRDVEAQYYDLTGRVNDPLKLPAWALNPDEDLVFYSIRHSNVLNRYSHVMKTSLQSLMEDCGFKVIVQFIPVSDANFYSIKIKFPGRIASNTSESQTETAIEVGKRYSSRSKVIPLAKRITGESSNQVTRRKRNRRK